MKNKIIKYALNGVILAAIAAIGVAAYQIGTSPTEEKFIVEMENTESEEFAMLEDDMAEDENIDEIEEVEIQEEELENSESESEEKVEEFSEMGITEVSSEENVESSFNEEGTMSETIDDIDSYEIVQETSVNSELIDIEVPEEDFMDVSVSSELMNLQFSESTEIQWPVQGELLLDYNMNQTIYFPTLEQYKLNPAIVVEANEDTPVFAAASGVVYDIVENPQTGTTITMELGDGYQAIYGQLKDLTVEKGEMIEKGTVLGYINVPTKYYSVEGSNLYFSMKRNGEYVNPNEYLPVNDEE